MAEGQNDSANQPTPHKWTISALISWVGGIVTIPALGWFLISIHTKVDGMNDRLTAVEKTNIQAIWDAIAKNRDADVEMIKAFSDMAVQYRAAMIVFERG